MARGRYTAAVYQDAGGYFLQLIISGDRRSITPRAEKIFVITAGSAKQITDKINQEAHRRSIPYITGHGKIVPPVSS